MRPLRWTEQDPDDVPPSPQTAGSLQPPGREPPTAIGLATAPRPPRPTHPTRYGVGLTHIQRATRAICAVGLVGLGSGAAIAIPTVVGIALAAGLLGAGAVVARHVILAPTVYERRSLELRKRRAARHNRSQSHTSGDV
jgi:hypothetical protein